MNKKEIRKDYLEKRKQLTSGEKLRLDDLMLINLQKIKFPEIETLFTYFPMEKFNEPNTFLFTNYMRFLYPGITIAYPKTNPQTNDMEALIIDEDTEYAKNAYGTREPASQEILGAENIDLAFVPLLAFDENGYRVGFGKGYYDKFLAQCRADAIKIGFSYFPPEDGIDDLGDFDIPLNLCITPQAIYEF